jgi:hypothetical protein
MTERTAVHAGTVTLAYVHGGNGDRVSHSWHGSLSQLVDHDAPTGRLVSWIAQRCGTDSLAAARNQAVADFLDEHDAEWLFWVDTDMGFEPDILERLVASADPVERPLVGALCFSWFEANPDGSFGYRCYPRPTILDWHREGTEAGFKARADYPANSLVRCSATGMAATLIHRAALAEVRRVHGDHWYDRIPNGDGGKHFGEDLSLCMRLGAIGVPVYVDTGARTTHHKSIWVGEPDYWHHVIASPARERAAVIVAPGSATHAEYFGATLTASSGLVELFAVVQPWAGDVADAWQGAGARVIPVAGDTPAARIEAAWTGGLISTEAPWLFLAAERARFGPGWLDHAEHVGARFPVVGTLDPTDPVSMVGEGSTGLLVSVDYVRQVGASLDGPGSLVHPDYAADWWAEPVVAARMRGAYGAALGAVVERVAMSPAELDAHTRIVEADIVLAQDRIKLAGDQTVHTPVHTARDGGLIGLPGVSITAVAQVQHHAPCVPECTVCYPPSDQPDPAPLQEE